MMDIILGRAVAMKEELGARSCNNVVIGSERAAHRFGVPILSSSSAHI